jgi:HSP20 family molecular chaperone IbpA
MARIPRPVNFDYIWSRRSRNSNNRHEDCRSRLLHCPEDADATKLAADFKDGVLKVHVPKNLAAERKAIQIKVQ